MILWRSLDPKILLAVVASVVGANIAPRPAPKIAPPVEVKKAVA